MAKDIHFTEIMTSKIVHIVWSIFLEIDNQIGKSVLNSCTVIKK